MTWNHVKVRSFFEMFKKWKPSVAIPYNIRAYQSVQKFSKYVQKDHTLNVVNDLDVIANSEII